MIERWSGRVDGYRKVCVRNCQRKCDMSVLNSQGLYSSRQVTVKTKIALFKRSANLLTEYLMRISYKAFCDYLWVVMRTSQPVFNELGCIHL